LKWYSHGFARKNIHRWTVIELSSHYLYKIKLKKILMLTHRS